VLTELKVEYRRAGLILVILVFQNPVGSQCPSLPSSPLCLTPFRRPLLLGKTEVKPLVKDCYSNQLRSTSSRQL